MTHTSRPRPPRSLERLRTRCADLFLRERTVIASQTPILITKDGDPYFGAYRIFPAPYDILSERSYHYLWEELRRIWWGIEEDGYTREELGALRETMRDLEDHLSYLPPETDLANLRLIRRLTIMN